MRRWLPWYGKIAAKLLLSRLPLGYSFWRKANLFAHGAMHMPEYAYGVFRQHFQRTAFNAKSRDFVALELGPGDSVLSALLARAHGAARCYLVDAGAFATTDLAPYFAMSKYLASQGIDGPDLEGVADIEDVLEKCNATYATYGLRSLQNIPSTSVDFVWSHAVLEHIRRHEFPHFMRELRRVLKPDGICSHRVDLKDHLGGALNNLRVPTRYWEADWMARSGFYTNRIRYEEMIEIFREADFAVEVVQVQRWDVLPTPIDVMAPEFRRHSLEDLRISAFDVLLKPTSAPRRGEVQIK